MQTSSGSNNNQAEDQDWLDWLRLEPTIYDEMVYKSNPVNSYINRHGHRWCEKQFGKNIYFNRVLEVGGGTGEHLHHIKHSYSTYHLTDLNSKLLDKARSIWDSNSKIIFEEADTLKLKYPDNYFDRLISMANLEHIPNPHIALKEWKRVVKPGGTISIMIPTEGGIAWNLGRYLTTRRYFQKKGLSLDYIIAREHINACYRLHALIMFYFEKRKDHWWPTGIPTAQINLIFATQIIVQK